jgi:hypothetical protein
MMNEETFNIELRKFLKTVGVTAQREIEKGVRQALAERRLDAHAKLAARMVLTIDAIGLSHRIDGEIDLG